MVFRGYRHLEVLSVYFGPITQFRMKTAVRVPVLALGISDADALFTSATGGRPHSDIFQSRTKVVVVRG